MAITAPPNAAVRNLNENRAKNTSRMPGSGVSLSQFYWLTRTIHQNVGVSRRKLATVGLFTAGLSAAISAEADASHYEHNPYLNYSCKDLALAATDVSRRAEEEVGVKSDTVQKNDSGELTIFWPRAFSAKVSGKEASDLSRLKDDMISIERAAIESECQIQFDGLRPPGA